jgi:Ca-activated chloride channel homolog
MRKLFLLLAPLVLFTLSFRTSNYNTVTGKITNEDGQPLSFVTVKEKNGKTSVSSDSKGFYKIPVSTQTSVLVFVMVGYEIEEIPIAGKTTIDVVLRKTMQTLQEVVVIGYGTQRKQTFVGSAQQKVYGYNAPPMVGSTTRVAGVNISGYPGQRNPTEFNTEAYDHINENGFKKVGNDPLSTFSIDVDAASYSNVRRYLNEGTLPPAGAVRIEEMINYFRYDYQKPEGAEPFSINTELAACPWNPKHYLALIGLQGKKIPVQNLPSSNFVFLIDVSGSMSDENKLPLVKASLKLLVDQLREQDKVAIVVYASAAGLVLPSTSGNNKMKINDAIEKLSSGGSTAGGQGIKLAYKIASENFLAGGNNRVILCTDGDFNVGASSDDEMERLIENERKSGVYLTVLGYGMGNYKDSKMQKLADKGNGNHAYIDGISEAKKVLVNEFGGTMFTIANDVKLQIEFNPAHVSGYRLIGYENRMLNKEDFNNDKKDAGELGSGHMVTALYEIIPAGVKSDFLKDVDPLKYQKSKKANASADEEVMTIKLRYKDPGNEKSKLVEKNVLDKHVTLESTSDNFRFAAAVAQFGMMLRNSEYKQASSYKNILVLADGASGNDKEGYRKEFTTLVKKASRLQSNNDVTFSDED